ncbi:hypothetical protein L1987_03286 [Smallanthus sonchifolius]|uniref:Uncharacterized protein n=1 Tax=Smallanthus sonchifolius TaxID=185202 RepID=A0ACB9KA63_9ASTR|nr:hypothetical protein L1987_03286 [Smallanthus sonchifolius]
MMKSHLPSFCRKRGKHKSTKTTWSSCSPKTVEASTLIPEILIDSPVSLSSGVEERFAPNLPSSHSTNSFAISGDLLDKPEAVLE